MPARWILPERPSVYETPSYHMLEIVAELNEFNMSYEFNMFVVWEHTITGDLYYSADAGCSCPTPYEWAHDLSTLTKAQSLDEIYRAIYGWCQAMDRKDQPDTMGALALIRRSWAVMHGSV
jgi:hypothetical protein